MTEMRLSMLQRKTKSELIQIAKAMGGRPFGSYTKARIIQMIIDLSSKNASKNAGVDKNAAVGVDKGVVASRGVSSVSSGVISKDAGANKGRIATNQRVAVNQKVKANDSGGAQTRGGQTGGTQTGGVQTPRTAKGVTATQNVSAQAGTVQSGATQNAITQAGNTQGAAVKLSHASSSTARSSSSSKPSPLPKPSPSTYSYPAAPAGDVESGNRRRKRRSRERDADPDEGWTGDLIVVEGRLDLRDEGYGFVRADGCLPSRNDAYVSIKMIRQFKLRRGDHIVGTSRPANRSEKNAALLSLHSINGQTADAMDAERPLFEALTPIHAEKHIQMASGNVASGNVVSGNTSSANASGDLNMVSDITSGSTSTSGDVTSRLLDIVAPLGFGQRVLIWTPKRYGVASILSSMISSVETNYPDVYVIGLFLDQRPEDVTLLEGHVKVGETASTVFDQPAEEHVLVAEMAMERAKRLAESGVNVVMFVDSVTVLARAYNATLSNAGKAYSGKIDSGAIHLPKKMFGVGRNLAEAGSVTMIATISTDTPKFRMLDSVIAEEFKGIANTEIRVDRWAAEMGLVPALDITGCVSHDESQLIDKDKLGVLQTLRKSWLEKASCAAGADSKELSSELSCVVAETPGAVVAALEHALKHLRGSAL